MEHEKYSKGTLYHSIAKITMILTSFIGGMLQARLIIQNDMGLYALSITLINFFILFSNFGLNGAITIHILKNGGKGSFRSFFWFRLVMSGLFGLSIFLASDYIANTYTILWNDHVLLGDLIRISPILLFVTGIYSFVNAIFFGKEEFKKSALAIIISQIIGLLLTIYILFTYPSAINIYITLILPVIFEFVLLVAFGSKFLFEKSETSKIDNLKAVLKISMPNFGILIFQYLYDTLIILLIGLKFFPNETATFYFGNNIAYIFIFFGFTVRQMGVPAFARLEEELKESFISKFSKFVLIAFLPLSYLIIAYSNNITYILYGVNYVNSGYILEYMIFYVLFRYLNLIFYVHYINRKNRIVGVVFQAISLSVFIGSYFILIDLVHNMFMGIFCIILGESILTLCYGITFLKEIKKTKEFLRNKNNSIVIFLYSCYIGGIFLIKYLLILPFIIFFIISITPILIYPVILGIFKLLNQGDFDFLEKVMTPMEIISLPILFILKIIKKISLKFQ